MNKTYKLLDNSRFYILIFSILLSVIAFCALRLQITSDQLFYIRAQQVFGLFAVIFLYGAIVLTPLSKLTGRREWLQRILFARRAIGVSAAYFTLLHVFIVMTKQVGGLSGISLLPLRFRVAFILGGIAAVVLLLMAATSFDKVIEKLTFPRWKMLHRFVYLAGILTVIHVWMIGTHAEKPELKWLSVIVLGALFALESIRFGRYLAKSYKLSDRYAWLGAAASFVVLMGSLLLMPILITNYHSDHHESITQERR